MLRRWKIRPRLLIGFGLMLLMSAVLAGIGAFGLHVSREALEGITMRLIPAEHVTIAARTNLLKSEIATSNMAAAIFSTDDIKRAKADWDAAQAALDKAMKDFGALAANDTQRDNLKTFAGYIATYHQAVLPVADKLANNGYAEAKDAFTDLKAADAAYQPALKMLDGIEDNLSKNSNALFDKVDTLVATLFGVLVVAFLVCVGLGVVLAWRVSDSIVEPVQRATRFAERIADGDLREAPAVQGADEAAEMMGSLAAMQGSLAQIVGAVLQAAESIQVASSEVATGNLDLSQRTEQTASNLQQTASSMNELTSTVNQSADAAGTAKQLAGTAADAAGRGGAVVGQVVATMGEISASSKKIADIIGTIDGIAFQTNILALNAAVEAARAGEQGRGFAVVAGEVRLLAQRSAEAAREIKALITTSVERVEAGTGLVNDAGSTMGEIVASVQRVADIIGEISSAASAQSAGIGTVNGAVGQLDQMTQQNAALVEQSAAAAQSLREQAQKLSSLMSRFRVA